MAYKLHYSDYVTSEGPPDPAEWVGPQGPPGPPGVAGPPGPAGITGGVPEAPTDGAIYGRQGTTTSWQGVLPLTAGSAQPLTGPLYLPSALPTVGQQATSKTYVDQQDAALQNAISSVAQNLVFVGQCHIPTDSTLFTPASGITPSPGPLPLATAVPKGYYVIVVTAGSPPGGSHIPAGSYTLHDWLISDGTAWVWLQLGLASYIASDIAISPSIGSLGANVQTGLQWLSDHTGVASFNTRTGVVTLSSGDVTTALTFTPYNATNPSGYQTAANVTTALAAGSPGAFSTLSASGAVSGAGFTTLLASYQTSAQVVASLAAGNPGAFSTLSASGAVSGAGFTTWLASPPAIGGTAANTGKFTNLTATGTTTVGAIGASGLATLNAGGTFTGTYAGTHTYSGAVTFTGTVTPSQTAGVVGTTTNNNANAGSVGEYLISTAGGGAMVTGTNANVASLSLTAGDWDVWARCSFSPGGAAAMSAVQLGISTTSATFQASGDFGGSTLIQATFAAGGVSTVNTGMARISIASTTTVFAVALVNWTGGTGVTTSGIIIARRAR